MRGGQMLKEMEGADLVALVGRIGNPVRKKKNFHPCAHFLRPANLYTRAARFML
jgi:hypothetical protein